MKTVDLLIRIATSAVIFLALIPAARANTIHFNDDVSSDSMNKLVSRVHAAAAAGDRNITVALDSGGGDLQAALRAYEELRAAHVNTYVSNECASACTVLFAAGATRTASGDAKFMFHAVKANKRHQKIFGKGLDKNRRDAIVTEYSNRWLATVRAVAPALAQKLDAAHVLTRGDDRWFTGRDLRSSGYVNN